MQQTECLPPIQHLRSAILLLVRRAADSGKCSGIHGGAIEDTCLLDKCIAARKMPIGSIDRGVNPDSLVISRVIAASGVCPALMCA